MVLVLALGVAAGLVLGGDDPKEPTSTTYAGGNGMVVTLPPGWSAGQDGRSDISAYTASDGFSGHSVNLDEGGTVIETGDDPVRLGEMDVWRDASDAPAAVRYFVPTTGGTVTISCEASPGAARGTLTLCERAASTLDLSPVRALPLPGVIERPAGSATTPRPRRWRWQPAVRRRPTAR